MCECRFLCLCQKPIHICEHLFSCPSVKAYLTPYVHVYLCLCLPVCLPTGPPARSPSCLSVRLSAYDSEARAGWNDETLPAHSEMLCKSECVLKVYSNVWCIHLALYVIRSMSYTPWSMQPKRTSEIDLSNSPREAHTVSLRTTQTKADDTGAK